MRHFEMLDQMTIDDASGIVTLRVQQAHEEHPQLALRREGTYIAISARYGPLEIALRPRYEDLVRLLSRLQPVEGSANHPAGRHIAGISGYRTANRWHTDSASNDCRRRHWTLHIQSGGEPRCCQAFLRMGSG